MTRIRSAFTLIALLAIVAVSLGSFAAPALADGETENGQDPPRTLLDPVEVIFDGITPFLQTLVTVLL